MQNQYLNNCTYGLPHCSPLGVVQAIADVLLFDASNLCLLGEDSTNRSEALQCKQAKQVVG